VEEEEEEEEDPRLKCGLAIKFRYAPDGSSGGSIHGELRTTPLACILTPSSYPLIFKLAPSFGATEINANCKNNN